MKSIPAAQHPDHTALIYGEISFTYRQLEAQSNQLARYLLGLDLPPQSRIALCLDRTPAYVIAILAMLKTGAAYVPVDPSYPADWIAHILKDAQPGIILASGPVPAGIAPIIDMQAALRSAESLNPLAPEREIPADAPAYLIYTSASTGDPKGVLISHANLRYYLGAMHSALGIESTDRFLHTASFAFSSSVRQLLLPLSRGAAVVLASPREIQDPLALFERVQQSGVTILDLVPTYWRTCVEVLRGLSVPQRTGLLENQVRLILSASERLLADVPRAWREEFHHPAKLVNMYGQTETSGIVSIYSIPHTLPDGAHTVPIGQPIPGASLHLLNETGTPVDIGVTGEATGEIHIEGPGVGFGYHGRPDLTSQRFIQGGTLYRTGDLGRALPNGDIEYLGRLDQQLKIRGFRVEPSEIECVLIGHPAVRNAAVLAVQGALMAFVVGETSDLRAYVRSRLPDYMVPAHFVPVEQIPLNPNGKVDRRALAAQWANRCQSTPQPELPAGPLEESLLRICSEVLAAGHLGPHDDLFELGAHSLSLMRITARVRATHGVQIEVEKAFDHPTAARLAACVREHQTQGGLERLASALEDEFRPRLMPPIPKRGGLTDAPLSSTQQGLWLLDQLHPGSPLYLVPVVIEITGPLDLAALEQSIQAVLERHSSLRTVFPVFEGQPVAQVLPVSAQPFHLRVSEAPQNEAIRRPFDLAAGPLFRAELLRLGPQSHHLIVTMHHIVADDWSIGILIDELVSHYAGRRSPDLPLEYSDYAMQQGRLESPQLREQLAYWERQLAGPLPVLELQAGQPRPAVRTGEGAKLYFQLSPDLLRKLKDLSRQEHCTLFMTLLAAFQTLLNRYTGQTDLLVGTPLANRTNPQFEGLIGAFVQTLVMRGDLSGNPTFSDLLQRTRRTALDAYANSDVPFHELVQALAPDRDPSRPPVFQAMFVLQNAPRPAMRLGDATLRILETDNRTSKFDLSLTCIESSHGLAGELEYDTSLFDHAAIERMRGHFETLLEAMVGDPSLTLAALPLLAPSERQQMLVEWNHTAADYPRDLCLHQLFEAQAERTPDAIAVVFEDSRLTYRELNQRANRLARYLHSQGVRRESLVALSLDRSLPLIAALLGILKAGAAYVPIDRAYPQERKLAMLEDSQAQVVLNSETIPLSDSFADTNPGYPAEPGDAAYVIYTSGSTAKPKGVVVTHRSVVNHATWFARHYQVSSADRVLQFASISFDAAAEEIYPFLFEGAAVVLRTDAVLASTASLVEFVHAQRITVLDLPTAFWQEWTAELDRLPTALPEILPATLRLVVVGGEKVSLESLALWRAIAPPHILWSNTYGPTEATISTSYFDVTRATVIEGVASVPIGRPVSNATMYVLDRHLNLVPAGVPGELHIGGDALARGYLRCPEITRERFIPIPEWLNPCPDGRLYKTGDLVRALPDGNLEFLGRADNQVKLRGFRIELGEIEALLDQHMAVRQSVAVVSGEGADKMVVAYVAQHPDSHSTGQDLKDYLRERLPGFMIPAHILMLDRLPLNANGKVDRRALPAPQNEANPGQTFAWPTTRTEERLAAIWAKVLKLERVGVHDNFFDLGGHSLKATQVMARIRDQFDQVLPLTTLFLAPTVEQLAAILDRGDAVLSISPVSAIQPSGTRRPLFCIHPDPVYGFRFNRLGEHLGGDQPLYGIQPVSLDGGRILTIEEIATNSIREMRAVQPEGPYALLGYCFGGFVAYEMAQQLTRQGETVGFLGLLDSVNPTYRRHMATGEQLNLPLRRMAYHRSLRQSRKNEANRDYLLDRARNLQLKAQHGIWRLGFAIHSIFAKTATLPELLRNQTEAFIQSGLHYRPAPYAGQVAVFRAQLQAPDSCLDPALGWKNLVPTTHLIELPGGHDYLLADPHVAILARHLQHLLEGTPAQSVILLLEQHGSGVTATTSGAGRNGPDR